MIIGLVPVIRPESLSFWLSRGRHLNVSFYYLFLAYVETAFVIFDYRQAIVCTNTRICYTWLCQLYLFTMRSIS